MRFLLYAILIMVCTASAHAVEMCIPTPPSSAVISATQTGQSSLPGAWSISGIAEGASKCTAAPFYTPEYMTKFNTFGKYCYCRLVKLQTPSGHIATFDGTWVFAMHDNYCHENCSTRCAERFKLPYLRHVLMASYESIQTTGE